VSSTGLPEFDQELGREFRHEMQLETKGARATYGCARPFSIFVVD
jgi:hypothetical protein